MHQSHIHAYGSGLFHYNDEPSIKTTKGEPGIKVFYIVQDLLSYTYN